MNYKAVIKQIVKLDKKIDVKKVVEKFAPLYSRALRSNLRTADVRIYIFYPAGFIQPACRTNLHRQ